MIKRAYLALTLALAQGLAPIPSQAQLPALGDGADMSTNTERRLGDRIARELYRDPDYVDDAVLGEYVQGIWQRLMAAARARGELSAELEQSFAWEVALGRDRSVNAFALPGGYLGVHLGLIAVVTSEDELASVLSHELSHVTQRHISRLMGHQGAQGPWLLAAMILGALAASRSPQAASAVIAGGQAVAIQGQLNFSRDMEREADRVGYAVSTQAGFEPRGFVTMFEKLQQANRFNDTGGFPYLRSHPLTTERIADMQSRQQLLPQRAPAELSLGHALIAARAGVLSNSKVDSLRSSVAQASAGTRGTQPLAQRAAALYAGALAAANLRDFASATRLHGALQALTRDSPPGSRLTRLLGVELALAGGDARRASELLGAGMLGPGPLAALARPELFLWARALTQLGQGSTVAQQLQVWLAQQPRDAQAWSLLSAAYAAQGLTLSAVRAQAESHAAHWDWAAARDRLKAAQDLVRAGTNTDHIEASIIDTRTREIELRLREQALER